MRRRRRIYPEANREREHTVSAFNATRVEPTWNTLKIPMGHYFPIRRSTERAEGFVSFEYSCNSDFAQQSLAPTTAGPQASS